MADKFLTGGKSKIPLAGNDDEIKTQLSLLLGVGQLLDTEIKGLGLNFYDFVKLFEDGFVTGFGTKQNVELNKKHWGQTLKARPKIRVIQESSKTWQNKGYALIELLPDRTVEEESYILFGTPAQLIQQIMYWMNLHRKLGNLDTQSSGLYTIPANQLEESVETQPQLILQFQESAVDARKNKRPRSPLRATHYIRIKQDFSSENEVKAIAQKVYSLLVNPLFKFDKGKVKYSYRDKQQGHSLILACPTESEARKVIEKILACVGQKPNWFRLTQSESKKVTEPRGTVRVNGKTYKRPPFRPTGTVRFISAELHVHGTNGNIRLLDLGKRDRNVVLPTPVNL